MEEGRGTAGGGKGRRGREAGGGDYGLGREGVLGCGTEVGR